MTEKGKNRKKHKMPLTVSNQKLCFYGICYFHATLMAQANHGDKPDSGREVYCFKETLQITQQGDGITNSHLEKGANIWE